MQFGKRSYGRSAAALLTRVNPFIGIASANTVAGVNILRQQAKLKQAAEFRQLSKVLGMPPTRELEEDLLAGGDITINRGGSLGPWIFASILALTAVAGTLWWIDRHPGSVPPTPTPTPSPVIPAPVQPERKSQDYIEFFRP